MPSSGVRTASDTIPGGRRPRLLRVAALAACCAGGAVGAALELLALGVWLGGRVWPGIALHIGGALLLTPALVMLRPHELRWTSRAGAVFTCVQVLALPVIGPVLLTLFHGLALRLRPPRDPFSEFEFHSAGYDEVLMGKPQETLDAPLLDLLPTLDTHRRRQAVLSLANLEPRRAVPILRTATRDTDEEVRLLAYGILNTIEDRLTRQLLEGRAERAAGAGDAERTSDEEHRHGDLYYEFYYLGLAGQQTQRFYLEHAARCYERSLELDPDQPRVRLKLARALVGLREPERAEQCLVAASLGGVPLAETMPWQAEVYFQRGELGLLIETAEALRREPSLSVTMKQAVDFWT